MASIPNTAITTKRQAPTLRGSSKGIPVYRRPRIMRSSATAPCLATSNASRNDLANLHPASRASALLSRVASYSLSPQSHDLRRSSDRSQSKSPRRHSHSPHNHDESFRRENRNLCVNGTGHDGGYFSFPNFDDFPGDRDDDEKLEKQIDFGAEAEKFRK